ncbi:MAG: SDR family oxidoreductase [Pseudomonadota bacterium]
MPKACRGRSPRTPSYVITEAVERAIPLRRLGTPEDVADVASFFVGEDSRYLTGQAPSIDGGLTMIG